jgi:hypothetical protein
MEGSRTVSKREVKSQKLQQEWTARPAELRCRSQKLPAETVLFLANHAPQRFLVYSDRQLGFLP